MDALDPARRSLTLDDGHTEEFGAIVLATGADPTRLAIPGQGGPTAFSARPAGSRALLSSPCVARAEVGAVAAMRRSFLGRCRSPSALCPARSGEALLASHSLQVLRCNALHLSTVSALLLQATMTPAVKVGVFK